MMCAVDDCVRAAQIELAFAPDHGEQTRRLSHPEYICGYHAGMAVEYFAEQGVSAPINTNGHKSRIMRDRTGRVQHYPSRRVRDNTEHDA